MVTNPAQQTAKRKRMQLIEELVLSGAKTKEIAHICKEQFGVAYGTVRNDISDIHKAHAADLSELGILKGKQKYLAQVRQVRRKSLAGWPEVDASGMTRIKGRDFKLVHMMDKEEAALAGVNLTANDRTITLNMEKARGYLELIFQVVFRHVKDPGVQKLILDDVEKIEEAGE